MSKEFYELFGDVFADIRRADRIEPLAEGDSGYGKYKIIDRNGHVIGWCGDQSKSALEKIINTEPE